MNKKILFFIVIMIVGTVSLSHWEGIEPKLKSDHDKSGHRSAIEPPIQVSTAQEDVRRHLIFISTPIASVRIL